MHNVCQTLSIIRASTPDKCLISEKPEKKPWLFIRVCHFYTEWCARDRTNNWTNSLTWQRASVARRHVVSAKLISNKRGKAEHESSKTFLNIQYDFSRV